MTNQRRIVTGKDDRESELLFTLGGESYEAAISDEAMYRLKYDQPINMYAILSPDFLGAKEHWVPVGDDKVEKVVCGVHTSGDNTKIFSKWGYPEGCPICAIAQRLYEEAPKESKDIVDVKKRSIAKDIYARLTYYLWAVKGDADTRRVGGRKVLEPYFEKMVPRRLILSRDAFDKFYKAYKDSGLTSDDAYGLPVNFQGGKNEGGFSSIQVVELFPKYRLKEIPEFNANWGALTHVTMDYLHKIAADFENYLPKILSGLNRGKANETATAKKGTVAANPAKTAR